LPYGKMAPCPQKISMLFAGPTGLGSSNLINDEVSYETNIFR